MTENPRGYDYAFPRTARRDGEFAADGMSVREWLAGQALAGIAAREGHDQHQAKGIAEAAVAYADALLAELEKSR